MTAAPAPHPAAEAFPPARIRVVTPRIELRLPTDEELVQLGHAAISGVHDPATMPFAAPWTDEPPDVLMQRMYAWHASARANWKPSRWNLLLVTFVDGEPVGAQDVFAADLAVRREIGTGSWLAQSHQGRGLGSEMRRAVLHLAFEGLGALSAISGAYDDNDASNHVSRACGYVENGTETIARRRGPRAPGGESAERATEVRYRIERDAWLTRRREDIELHGLDPDVLEFLGATSTD
jgi:RimJ/RimL family protein N-acetyltransferase